MRARVMHLGRRVGWTGGVGWRRGRRGWVTWRKLSRVTTPEAEGSARSMICLSSGVCSCWRTRSGIEYFAEPTFMFCRMKSIELPSDCRSMEWRTCAEGRWREGEVA